jgi:hypothetical protein
MFFVMGITDDRKDFDFNQVITCDICVENMAVKNCSPSRRRVISQ